MKNLKSIANENSHEYFSHFSKLSHYQKQKAVPLHLNSRGKFSFQNMTTQSEFKFWNFNIWQNLATTGIIVSGMSQLGLHFTEREVNNFSNVYWIWLFVFLGGTLLKYYYFKNGIEPDHHHHHDH